MIPRKHVLEPVPVLTGRGDICWEVLESLPEWFGIPASVENYVATADELPMLRVLMLPVICSCIGTRVTPQSFLNAG